MAALEVARSYFDLNSHVPEPVRGGGKPLHWIPQYLAVLAGVLIEPAFTQFRKTAVWDFSDYPGWLWFSLVATFLIFPAIYKKAFDPEQPVVVMLAPIFAAGLGWQVLLGSVVTAATRTPQV